MKRTLFLIVIFLLITNCSFAAQMNSYRINTIHTVSIKERPTKDVTFENRLNLTEEQKLKAKKLRKKGHAQIKPIMNKLEEKHREYDEIRFLGKSQDEKKLLKLNNDIKSLEKKAHKIRRQNMKEFESLLTDEQKNILREMKQEGRKKYQENHPMYHRNPFGMPPERRF